MLGARRKGGRATAGLFAHDGRRLVLHVGCGPPYEENRREREDLALWADARRAG